MRALSFWALWLALPIDVLAANAPVISATVYADSAQVTRRTVARCSQGVAIFDGLTSTLDEKTLQAQIEGRGSVVGISPTKQVTGPRPAVTALKAQLAECARQRKALDDLIDEQRLLLEKVDGLRKVFAASFSRQSLVGAAPRWDQAADLLRQRELLARRRIAEAERRKHELDNQRRDLAGRLAKLKRADRRTTLAVRVFLRCSGQQPVRLSYVVPGASWSIHYRVEAKPGGRLATISAEAEVSQGSGEAWNDVELFVSTANLQRDNTPPKISPLRVYGAKLRDERKVLVRRFEHRRHLKTGSRLPVVGSERLASRLRAARRVSLPADGQRVRVPLVSRSVRASVALEAVPKVAPHVYRRLTFDNPFDFVLLAGPVDLLESGRWLGRASVADVSPGEPMSFSLGVENQITVQRYIKSEVLVGASSFGSSKRLEHRYQFIIGNWTQRQQTIGLREHIPVSQVDEVKVKLGDKTTAPVAHDKQDGHLLWQVRVDPRSQQTVVLDYQIELPKSYAVRGYARAEGSQR
ncbi:MAG: DUF4139 domain-containing protein [Deltaproteobacteria bacterium]|nr:DUF4139 domain-containing protein [Deltaproteobacteria bacterium]